MGLFDTIKNRLGFSTSKPVKEIEANTHYEPIGFGINRFKGSNKRRSSNNDISFYSFIPRSRQYKRLDYKVMENKRTEDLLKILMDNHPDVSFALWEFLRLGMSGYKVKAYKVKQRKGKGDLEENKKAQVFIDEYIRDLANPPATEFYKHNNSLDKVVGKLLQFCVLYGASSVELGLTKSGEIGDIFVVNPSTIDFGTNKKDNRIIPFQFQLGKGYIPLDIPSFFYEGLDEFGDEPYGRAPFQAVISTVFFQMQVLQDLRAVVHSQGYPRIDIQIIEEALMAHAPPQVRTHPDKKQEYIENQLTMLINEYSSLDPDDALVHLNSVEIGVIGEGNKALIDPQKLFSVIDNQIQNGLKILSTMLGRRGQGSSSETYSKMEMKLFIKSVESIQAVVERILSNLFTYVMRYEGHQGFAEFKFNPIELRTEQEQHAFLQIKISNYERMRDNGWITNDEAAQAIIGHDAVSDPIVISDDKTPKGNPDERTPDNPSDDDNPSNPDNND